MVVLSVLRNAIRSHGQAVIQRPLATNIGTLVGSKSRAPTLKLGSRLWIQIRHGHGKRKLFIRPSQFLEKQFFDELVFYTLLGVIPLGLAVFLVNVFIGPAELAEIPEGYEPRYWEYYRHPISRWMSKTFYASPQERYESFLSKVLEEQQLKTRRMEEDKMHSLMKERGDYIAYYYVPVTEQYDVEQQELHQQIDDQKGFSASVMKSW